MTNRECRETSRTTSTATRGDAGTTMVTPQRNISLVPPTGCSRGPRDKRATGYPLLFFFLFRPGSKGTRAASNGHRRRAIRDVGHELRDRCDERRRSTAAPVHLTRLSSSVGNARAVSQLESAFARLHGCRHLGPRTRRPAPIPTQTAPNEAVQRGYKNTRPSARPESRAAAAVAGTAPPAPLAADARCCRVAAATNKGRPVGRAGAEKLSRFHDRSLRGRDRQGGRKGGSARFVFFPLRRRAWRKRRKNGSVLGNPASGLCRDRTLSRLPARIFKLRSPASEARDEFSNDSNRYSAAGITN